MTNFLQSFIGWAKDPFGKKEISRHNVYINEMHVVQKITQNTNQKVISRQRPPRVVGGANAIDRSILGTHQRKRKSV